MARRCYIPTMVLPHRRAYPPTGPRRSRTSRYLKIGPAEILLSVGFFISAIHTIQEQFTGVFRPLMRPAFTIGPLFVFGGGWKLL